GSKGMAVWAMQTLLNAKGFDCGDADGDCGEKTVAAIMALQIAYGLGVDGECGKMTWAVLING
ncbi:MAG: peptidoglycan-binding protein, partial [Clostridia bacterium]|nr:peptidoglycan-binding protein [Clostridia bacterium]